MAYWYFSYECLKGGPEHDVVLDVRLHCGPSREAPAVNCPICGRPMEFCGRWEERNAG